MRFIVDANVSPDVARLLAAAGHDAVAVRDVQLQHAPDDEILDWALADDRVIISHDTDFGTLAGCASPVEAILHPGSFGRPADHRPDR